MLQQVTESKPEVGRLRRPVLHIVLERVAVQPQVISPVGHLLLLHIKARLQPHRFGRILRVVLQPLRFRQPEKVAGHLHHVVYDAVRDAMVYNL